ncbi:MAG: pyridoxal-phosphate dependent enzyme, partial [Deltaproteobacteria bacterium]|nr:pyridoxal-phosphate dependent enzyme [Deltaproteobacteria bacterium]
MVRMYFNPSVTHPLREEEPNRAPRDFHRRLPGYAPTPLIPVPQLAAKVGVGQVWVKDESNRLGLPSFKILGAWWATYQMLLRLFGQHLEPWSSLQELSKKLQPLRPLKLIAATDGNHGRAVARIAALLGFASRIFVPSNTSPARIDAIASEGAEVVVVDGSYEAALSQ